MQDAQDLLRHMEQAVERYQEAVKWLQLGFPMRTEVGPRPPCTKRTLLTSLSTLGRRAASYRTRLAPFFLGVLGFKI